MAFAAGSCGVYEPIRGLFKTSIYVDTVESCWCTGLCKTHIALMVELLRLRQENHLSSSVNEEDMCDLLVEETDRTFRVKLWELEVGEYEEDVQALIQLVWKVNTSMKMRDVLVEAQRLLRFSEDSRVLFQHPYIIREAKVYARKLMEKQLESPKPKSLAPSEVVINVVPKVLQDLWKFPANILLSMPSRALRRMAVGVTKAVEDQVFLTLPSLHLQTPFHRSAREELIQCVLQAVRKRYSDDVLTTKLMYFDADVLRTITEVAAEKICLLFGSQDFTVVTVDDIAEMANATDDDGDSGVEDT